MATVPKGKKVTVGGKTYRPGDELPSEHAKLLDVPHSAKNKAKNESTKTS
jgi:hypothetical protein